MKVSRLQNYVSAVFNLMNAILGAGIVGLPFALTNLGYIIFILLLLTVACLAMFSINLFCPRIQHILWVLNNDFYDDCNDSYNDACIE